jgi:hypothetical protein
MTTDGLAQPIIATEPGYRMVKSAQFLQYFASFSTRYGVRNSTLFIGFYLRFDRKQRDVVPFCQPELPSAVDATMTRSRRSYKT